MKLVNAGLYLLVKKKERSLKSKHFRFSEF